MGHLTPPRSYIGYRGTIDKDGLSVKPYSECYPLQVCNNNEFIKQFSTYSSPRYCSPLSQCTLTQTMTSPPARELIDLNPFCNSLTRSCTGTCEWGGTAGQETCAPRVASADEECKNKTDKFECTGLYYGCYQETLPPSSTASQHFHSDYARCKSFNTSDECNEAPMCTWDAGDVECKYDIKRWQDLCKNKSEDECTGQCQMIDGTCTRRSYCASEKIEGMYTEDRQCRDAPSAVCSKWEGAVWNADAECTARIGNYDNDILCTQLQDGTCINYKLMHPQRVLHEGTYTGSQISLFDSIDVKGPHGCKVDALGKILTPGSKTHEVKYVGGESASNAPPTPYVTSLQHAEQVCKNNGFDQVCHMSDMEGTLGKCKCGWITDGLQEAWRQTGCLNPLSGVDAHMVQQWRNPNLGDIDVYNQMFNICQITQSGGRTGGVCTANFARASGKGEDIVSWYNKCTAHRDQTSCTNDADKNCQWNTAESLGLTTIPDISTSRGSAADTMIQKRGTPVLRGQDIRPLSSTMPAGRSQYRPGELPLHLASGGGALHEVQGQHLQGHKRYSLQHV